MLVQQYPDSDARINTIDKTFNGQDRILINGKKTCNSKCPAYCNFSMHKGFLNEKLIEKHQCHKKQCSYLFSVIKMKKTKTHIYPPNNTKDEVLRVAQDITKQVEYLKPISVTECEDKYYVNYASVCKIDEELLSKKVSDLTFLNVTFRLVNQSIENMTRIVFGN